MPQATLYSPLRKQYEARIRDGDLRPDSAQMEAVEVLTKFADWIRGYKPPQHTWLSRFLTPSNEPLPFSGFYLYGEVGRGKSMLMDMFYSVVAIPKKRRVHFHQFMLEIQERLFKLQADRVDDILPSLARDLAKETWLLCFDEFHVNNIADAMILGRLFQALFDAGVLIVATSNWAPDQLYKNGLQRDRFLPFITLIEKKMVVYRLAGPLDHRYKQMRGLPAYTSPLSQETTRKMQGVFLQLTGEATPEAIELPVQGRTLKIVHAAKGVGFFNFDELCGAALGPADYLAIASCLHTVVLDGVPKLSSEQRNETLRFMTLIDTLYEAKVKLFMATAVGIEKLAVEGEHGFAFQRTVSRLMEMQSDEYRRKPHVA